MTVEPGVLECRGSYVLDFISLLPKITDFHNFVAVFSGAWLPIDNDNKIPLRTIRHEHNKDFKTMQVSLVWIP